MAMLDMCGMQGIVGASVSSCSMRTGPVGAGAALVPVVYVNGILNNHTVQGANAKETRGEHSLAPLCRNLLSLFAVESETLLL